MSQQRHQQVPPPKQAAAQARYQEVAKRVHSVATKRFPDRPISQIKFVQVNTPANVVSGQEVNLTGAIEGRDLKIVIPAGARPGRQFEVPYILFDDSGVDGDIVVGDPFFVFPPVLSAREADDEAARQLCRRWKEEHSNAVADPALWKSKGNEAFNAKKYREALRLYGAAVLACLERVRSEAPMPSTSSDNGTSSELDAASRQEHLNKQKKLAQDLEMHIMYNNQALALLKLKPPRAEEALEATENALNIDPHYVKALFRAGQALQLLNRWGDAVNAFKRAVELKPDDAGLQKALKKSTDRLKSLEAAAAGQRGGDLHASSHAVPDLPRPSGTGRTSNEKVRQKVSTKAPLRGLYNDKEVTRMYEWGPLPENGEYNGGYLTSGGGAAANARLMEQFYKEGRGSLCNTTATSGGAASAIGRTPGDNTLGSQLAEADRCAKWVDIVEYKFEDHLDKVVVTVDGVDGADKLPPGRVTCELEETAMVLKIRGVRYHKIQGSTTDPLVNLRMVCGELWGKILAQQSGVVARGDQIIVTLMKNTTVSDRPWERLEYGKGGSWGAYGT